MGKIQFDDWSLDRWKDTLLLEAAHNKKEMGMETLLLTADFDDSAENQKITSRIGISAPAELYSQGSNLLSLVETKLRV